MADGVGSSPRMRGKLRVHNSYNSHERLIPAHAGKTEPCSRPSRHLRAHPRACGENPVADSRELLEVGSSPRMRGKPFRLCEQTFCDGLIPAHAGKTCRLRVAWLTGWAHPRACGENVDEATLLPEPFGSSPRMRGKPLEGRPPLPTPMAHPRACGENAVIIGSRVANTGSSPRMRGKHGP